jgi:hypothetical protein
LHKLRWHLAGRRVGGLLLPHLILVGKALDAHQRKLRAGATKELRSARGLQKWWRQKKQGTGKQ